MADRVTDEREIAAVALRALMRPIEAWENDEPFIVDDRDLDSDARFIEYIAMTVRTALDRVRDARLASSIERTDEAARRCANTPGPAAGDDPDAERA